MSDHQPGLLAMTTGIIANYVTNNRISSEDLPGLVRSVHAALAGIGQPAPVAETEFARPGTAEIRRSITNAGIVSFIDGSGPHQSLKRHLTNHGLTMAGYRSRYRLPDTYPQVSPAYSSKRSAIAKALGLGQKGRVANSGLVEGRGSRKGTAAKDRP